MMASMVIPAAPSLQMLRRDSISATCVLPATFSSKKRLGFRLHTRLLQNVQHLGFRESHRLFVSSCDLSQDLEETGTNDASIEDISVASTATEAGRIKMKVDVSGAKTEAIFEDVFSKMVSAAQPIPGFRRVKGGKTPNISRDVLIQILGPSKVYKQVIKKIINSTVAEYVEKQKLKVTKNLIVEQSFEELEDVFEPGEAFSFDAIIQLQEEKA